MEEYASNKIETFDELVTKHTRRDLEELALKYGLENLGGTKSQLAEYILEAMKKKNEPPKSIPQVSPQEVSMSEKPMNSARPASFGNTGVLAKANAINNKAADIRKAGKEIREQGIREMNRGINAQIKENHEAAAKIYSGAKAIRSSQEKMSPEFQKAGTNIRDDGYKNLQNGLVQFRRDLESQIKENREAVSRLNSGAVSLQNEIHRYQEQDLKNYVRDFYYG